MTSYEKTSLVIQSIIAIGAVIFGFWQILINRRLKALQDFVAITIVPGDANIRALNTGKINLYIHKFEMPGNVRAFARPRMVPAGGGDSSYYWLPLPSISSVTEGQVFSIMIYLTDQHGKKYVSENEGVLEKKLFTVWSNRTSQRDWSF